MGTFSVEEKKRTVLFTDGRKETFRDVTEVDTSGNWLRFKCAEGYVLVNGRNVNAIVIDGEKVR